MRLRFIHPAIGEVVFPVQLDSHLVIGRRGGGAGIELNWDKRISRRHAALRVTPTGELFFMDLGSSNGSFYGAQRIAPMGAERSCSRLRQWAQRVLHKLPCSSRTFSFPAS